MQNLQTPSPAPQTSSYSPDYAVSAPPRAPLAVVGYARVSTQIQAEKTTIKTQVELIERYCVEKGYRLVEMICDDGVSGTLPLEQRPGGRRLLELARDGKMRALVVYRGDRIGRSTWVNESVARTLYDELGIDFQGVAEKIDLGSPLGRAMFTFSSAIASLERSNTLQRSRDATIRLTREGTWLGGMVPFGFRVEGKDREARLRIAHEVDPITGFSEAQVVAMMFEWSANDGLSSIQIADRLNDLGIPTAYVRDERQILKTGSDGYGKRKVKTSGLWLRGRVRNMLVEPTYKGLHVWGRRGSKRRLKTTEKTLVERVVPAIVDAETWANAQLTLARNRIARPDIEKRAYLLRGLMKCAHCGLTFVGTVSQGKEASRLSERERENTELRGNYALRPYYICNGKNASHRGAVDAPACPSGHIRAKELEDLVWGEVEGSLNQPELVLLELSLRLRERNGGEGGVGESDLSRELERVRNEVAGKEAERNALYRLFRRGTLSEIDLDAQLLELVDEEAAFNAQLLKLERETEKAKDAKVSLDGAGELLNALKAKVSNDDSWETKRRVLEALVTGVEIETHYDESARRGRQRTVTLRITYRFETPELDDLAPMSARTGKTPVVVLGLTIQRTHRGLDFGFDPHACARDAARELLQNNPKMKAWEVIAQVLADTGQTISPASISRLRHKLKTSESGSGS